MPLDASRSSMPAAPRVYRLLAADGQPHPVLDDWFESHEQALEAGLIWCQVQGLNPQPLGLEVSTPRGDWRTLRHPCSAG